MAIDGSPDRTFFLTTVLWGKNPNISEYFVADKKCTTLKPGMATYLVMFARDGKSFLYSVASRDDTTIFRQAWRDGSMIGSPTPALKLPFAMREDYGGNAFSGSLQYRLCSTQRPRRLVFAFDPLIPSAWW
jgi:hypothetical protein